jgi:gamma-glutamyl-gamma-aminobutyrate hydrolase PuuD
MPWLRPALIWEDEAVAKPVIGITCYLEPAAWGAWEIRAAVLPHWYLDTFADAQVVLIPPTTDDAMLDRLDGLVLVGGADVDARLYGAPPHETADAPRETRDASEILLYRGARRRGMPVFGICRGLQIMAVAHGGSLIQNLPDLQTGTVHRIKPAHFNEHGARLTDGSMIARLLGSADVVVNSSHHQAVERAGDLTVTGYAEDGTVEVCEDPSAQFCLGVQWHPEHPDRRVVDRPLVEAFLAAALQYRSARPIASQVLTGA